MINLYKKYKNDIILLGIILVVAIVAIIIVNTTKKQGSYVVVIYDQNEVAKYSINEDIEIKLTYEENNYNTLVIKDGKVAMIHSQKYNYYKFPGGGMEKSEDQISTLLREVKEETGLSVIPESVKEYGMVRRLQKGEKEDIFVQENYYYICDVEEEIEEQKLDDYEEEEAFTLEYVTPEFAIDVNRNAKRNLGNEEAFYSVMIERDSLVLESFCDMRE